MHLREDLLNKLRSAKEDLQSRYPISSLALFGSSARNDATPESDIDLLVEFNGRVGIRYLDLLHELEVIFKKPVDLVSKNGLKPKYFREIQKDLIYV